MASFTVISGLVAPFHDVCWDSCFPITWRSCCEGTETFEPLGSVMAEGEIIIFEIGKHNAGLQ